MIVVLRGEPRAQEVQILFALHGRTRFANQTTHRQKLPACDHCAKERDDIWLSRERFPHPKRRVLHGCQGLAAPPNSARYWHTSDAVLAPDPAATPARACTQPRPKGGTILAFARRARARLRSQWR